MKKITLKKGFTLIELLIVIAIIGILAVALLPNILGAPKSARDTARKVALNDVIVAIEQYKATNGKLPGATSTTAADCITTDASGNATGTVAKNIDSLIKGHISGLITDKSLNQPMTGYTGCTSSGVTKGIMYSQPTDDSYNVCVGLEVAGTGAGYYSVSNAGALSAPAATGSQNFCMNR